MAAEISATLTLGKDITYFIAVAKIIFRYWPGPVMSPAFATDASTAPLCSAANARIWFSVSP